MTSAPPVEDLRFILSKGDPVWELLQAVSRSGDTRYVRLLVATYGAEPRILEITERAAKLCNRSAKDGRFKLFRGEEDGSSVRLLSLALYDDPEALRAEVL